MRKLKAFIRINLAAFFFGAGLLSAQDLVVSLEAFKITQDSAAEEVLVLAEEAAPGDLIEYRALCENTTDSAMKDVFAEIPVPEGLVWLASSDKPKAIQARLADGRLVTLPALDEEGKALPAELIRSLRWKIESIAAGEAAEIALRASVNR